MMNPMTTIEILYFEGCPGGLPVIDTVRRIAADEALDAEVIEVLVIATTVEQHRFLGSPSVRVDGVDVDPSASGRTDFHIGCRMYETRAGLIGMPPDEWIRIAMREAHGPRPVFSRGRTCECAADCWCRTGWKRRFRWLWPTRHIGT